MPINMSVEYPKLEAENQKLKRLLHDLTPGGSEFYNDPEYCAKWVKEDRFNDRVGLKQVIMNKNKENTLLLQRNKELLEALEYLVDKMTDRELTHYAINKAKAAIENNKP